MELLLGSGPGKTKRFNPDQPWEEVIRLDINPDHNPDVLWDLEKLPYPFQDNQFDEIHAYEVLEHLGDQGDYRAFFAQFSELWRILKPNGKLCATVPDWESLWAWGDPSHRRIINAGTLAFLSQEAYKQNVGITAMSDFRYLYKADFKTLFMKTENNAFNFVLEAIK